MLKAYSVQTLNHISKKKEIWCYGCGKRLNDILEMYENETFTSKITLFLDSNSLLWGREKRVGDRWLAVNSPDIIKSNGTKKVLLLITSDSYWEIYKNLFEILMEAGVDCSRYPVCYYTYASVLSVFCKLIPIRRQMLFNAGKEPHENTKALTEYLFKQYKGKEYRLVFLTDKQDAGERLPDVTYIERNTLKCKSRFRANLKYCFYISVSKYIFYENEPIEKVRKGQVLVYLNHGTIPLKNVADVLKQPKELDYALCPSEGCSDIYMQQYNIPKKKLIYAMPPRCAYLREGGQGLNRLIGCNNRQVIIWLPTFRTLKGTDRKDSAIVNALSLISSDRDWIQINEQLRKNGQILLIKYHPRERKRVDISVSCDCIYVLADEDLQRENLVLQEILGSTAALLTDYSGISFEYLLVDRPIGYVVNDFADYIRGFAFDNPRGYMPGTMINTIEELQRFLDDVKHGRDTFHDARKALAEKLFHGNELKDGSQELIRQLENLKKQG